MNSATEWSYGLYFGEHLGGVICFGAVAGSNVAASVCGAHHRHKVAIICRGLHFFGRTPIVVRTSSLLLVEQ